MNDDLEILITKGNSGEDAASAIIVEDEVDTSPIQERQSKRSPVLYCDDTWIGEAIKSKGHTQYYSAALITISSGDEVADKHEVIEVGSCVELLSDAELPYLVRIDELFETDGEKYMNSSYFYRQEDVSKSDMRKVSHALTAKDVFISDHREVPNLLSCVSRVCSVHYEVPRQQHQLTVSVAAAHSTFVCRYFYDTKKKRKLRALTPQEMRTKEESTSSVQLASSTERRVMKMKETTAPDSVSAGFSAASKRKKRGDPDPSKGLFVFSLYILRYLYLFGAWYLLLAHTCWCVSSCDTSAQLAH